MSPPCQLLVILATAVVIAVGGCSPAAKHCPACDRPECAGLGFRVVTTSGEAIETCCARCGLHYLRTHKVKPRALEVTDHQTGRRLDVRTAVFVEGSDVAACAAPETRRDAQGCCYVKGFDRCLPSLVAFAGVDAARAFQQQHGGRILTFEQLSR